jgi:hypothetical protein
VSGCKWPGKQRHASKQAALAAIRQLYRAQRGNPDLEPYPCGDHWHVGHGAAHFQQRIRKAVRGRGRTKLNTRRRKR